jgi:chromosome segregation ATPase
VSETLTLFRRRAWRSAPHQEIAGRDETIAVLRRRLEHLQNTLDASTRERVALKAAMRELTASREETEGLTVLMADALNEHRAALAALEHALG